MRKRTIREELNRLRQQLKVQLLLREISRNRQKGLLKRRLTKKQLKKRSEMKLREKHKMLLERRLKLRNKQLRSSQDNRPKNEKKFNVPLKRKLTTSQK